MKVIQHYFLATRPSFLTITLLGCLIGLLSNSNPNKQNWGINLLAVVVALLAHAAANVLNDYFDHLNGTDSRNLDRITPFTGGSRFIQEKTFSPKQIYQFGLLLLLVSIFLGLYICHLSTWALLPIGIFCIALAWMYSAPPLELMAHGLFGELAIALSWALIVIGFASLQSHYFDGTEFLIALAYGLMVANILFLNQIPDIKADMNSRKMTLAVQSPKKYLWVWYLAFPTSAYMLQALAVYLGLTPSATLTTILVAPLFIQCARKLKNGEIDRHLMSAIIPLNILGVHLYALLLCLGLIIESKVLF